MTAGRAFSVLISAVSVGMAVWSAVDGYGFLAGLNAFAAALQIILLFLAPSSKGRDA